MTISTNHHQHLSHPTETDTQPEPAALSPQPTEREQIERLLRDQPIGVGSLAAGLLGLEQHSVLREMQQARTALIRFHLSAEGGNLPLEEAVRLADGPTDAATTDRLIRELLTGPVTDACWEALEQVHARAPKVARKIWQLIREEARREFESGHQAAAAFEPVHWLKEPYRRAQYLGLRESFIGQWQPRGGIELALIDQLTISFYLYLYWTEVTVTRTQTQMRRDPPVWAEMLARRHRGFPAQREPGDWDPPQAREIEAADHAAEMADRYQRAFQRTLRALRDLRRYAVPVTINNPQQVNIATDGAQQVNVAGAEPAAEAGQMKRSPRGRPERD